MMQTCFPSHSKHSFIIRQQSGRSKRYTCSHVSVLRLVDVNFAFQSELIVVTGGNVFKLKYALFQKDSVVDAIRDAVNRGVVYASQSAGSVIAGESIGWTHQKNGDSKGKIDNPPHDWPDFDDPENWNALALIDKNLFVHFKEEDHKQVMDLGKLQSNGNTFILPDPQTLFVSDGFMVKCVLSLLMFQFFFEKILK